MSPETGTAWLLASLTAWTLASFAAAALLAAIARRLG